MKIFVCLLFIVSILSGITQSQTHRILESTAEHIKIEFNFENSYQIKETEVNGRKYNYIEGKDINIRLAGEPWVPNYNLKIGIPYNSELSIEILSIETESISDKFIIPAPDSLDQPFELFPYNMEVYNNNQYFPQFAADIDGDFIMRYARIASVSIAPYQFNPVTRELIHNKKLTVKVSYKSNYENYSFISKIQDKMTDELLKSSVINYSIAKDFIGKLESNLESKLELSSYWYNPEKDYYKIYLNLKGVYRITYEMLVNAGIPSGSLEGMNFELFNDGNSIAIDIVDKDVNGVFNAGDYFQFVGGPASPSDQYTRMNIYNKTNVYWFSYQADSTNLYKYIDGFPRTNLTPLITNTIETIKWEKDLLYQRFGLALNDQRDYWHWGYAEARNRAPFRDFIFWIEDSIAFHRVVEKPDVTIKVGMHGLTSTSCSGNNGHDVTVRINSKAIGTKQWNGQESAVFEKNFQIASFTFGGGDTVQIFEDKQKFEINMFGNICDGAQNDFVFINYVHFDYWRWNRTFANNYSFVSPPNNFQENRYYLWRWKRDNMKIYIPSRGELISNPDIRNDADESVYFVDTISVQTEYFCVADDYFLQPDSLVKNINSDLRNTANGADYIIITHKDFLPAAQQLAQYRESNLAGFTSPRVKVIEVDDIYNEFSYGLLNPYALQAFAKHAFDNWVSPAPKYMVLFGDMSSDYRSVYATSRKNFIPSVPYHAFRFGQLPSDNSIAAVAGNGLSPDIAIGRLSCETLEEANVLVNKIINYPADNTKPWKENVILLASGLSYEDQILFRFNNASHFLESQYLTPNGITSTKVFNFPEPPDIQYLGGGPKMRQEINNGAAIVNYYGHGGGAQWDLVFTKDDINELDNPNKLPVVLSITCYTAHFDNTESFGELFIKIPNKGAIGFWGSVGLTFWQTGKTLNERLFNQVFNTKNYVIGDAILSAKAAVGGGVFDQMLAQLSYLGDPAIEITLPKAPDFTIKSSDISISPTNPLKEDTVSVNVNIRNWGIVFPNDSVTVELFANSTDSTNLIEVIKLPSFGFTSTAEFTWVPQESGLYTLIARVNERDVIEELDHSDNMASNSFTVFDFGQPNIVKPVNGYFTSNSDVNFVLSDIGFYFDREFKYKIQIKNNLDFTTGGYFTESPELIPIDGIVKWTTPSLPNGEYFWRALIYDVIDTNYSPTNIFSITNQDGAGYISQMQSLQVFEVENMDYSEQYNAFVLNTDVKPPYPSQKFFVDSIMISLTPDSTEPSTFVTDGTYFYYGHLPTFTNGANSKIYKVGTGYNGTVKGQNYGLIPNLEVYIYSHLMSHDGFIYVCTGPLDNLLQINPETGDTSRVQIPDSLLLTNANPTQIGGVYIYSDGELVYNLATGTSLYPDKFVMRTFDPSNNWEKVGDDIIFGGSTMRRVSSFFVVNGHTIIYENYNLTFMRRYSLPDGLFEEEWRYAFPSKNYYGITYDHLNNFVYFTAFRPGTTPYLPGFYKYAGTFIEANGAITSQEIGPASKWHNLEFNIDQTNSNGIYRAFLLGKNKGSGAWETIDTLTQQTYSLIDINVDDYNYLKMDFVLVDSSFGAGQPMKFNSLKVNYDYLPEISMIPKDMTFSPDSILQGIDINLSLRVNNYGYIPVDSLRLDFYLNEGDSVYFTRYISVQPDSFTTFNEALNTSKIIFENSIRALATAPVEEYYSYNNLIENGFYVARDSIKPTFTITFDGKEILNGDIISSKPMIVMTLEDDGPLPLTPELFTIVHQNVPLKFENNPDLLFTSTPYPNSKAEVIWTPTLDDGRHTLEVLAKDSSGNFFDSTSNRSVFFVYSDADIRNVYNYPNPFKDNTQFTFELRGTFVPEELRIKIYTIAGRLIREVNIPPGQMQIGFNQYYWDGKDEDGDEIANGLYFYKVITKHEGEIRTVTQKLAKVK